MSSRSLNQVCAGPTLFKLLCSVSSCTLVLSLPCVGHCWHAGVVYNDANGDGKRQLVVGGKGSEGGVPNARISVYVTVSARVVVYGD